MASLIRIGVSRLGSAPNAKHLFSSNDVNVIRMISTKLQRSQDTSRPKKPAPWPYNVKKFTILTYLFDRTSARIDENSKIIVVEGPVAAGKTKVAKQLAEELDMLYLPEANLDMVNINQYGFNLRQLDEQLPVTCRSFDIQDFLANPKHLNAAAFQLKQYQTKFSQYIDALAHVLSTGQGVVLDRCVYSDFVFIEAMLSQGYVSKAARNVYFDYRKNTIDELLQPHLVVYLDVPVKGVLANIQKRGLNCEKNSPVLTPEYLGAMEKTYKQKYLKDISQHAELLVYDWSEGGEVEIVVEDIERINFDNREGSKFKDWEFDLEDDWGVARHKYADKKKFLMTYFNVPTIFQVPELCMEGDDAQEYHNVMNEAPGEVFAPGYNAAMGDKGLLFKTRNPPRDTLPLRERNLS